MSLVVACQVHAIDGVRTPSKIWWNHAQACAPGTACARHRAPSFWPLVPTPTVPIVYQPAHDKWTCISTEWARQDYLSEWIYLLNDYCFPITLTDISEKCASVSSHASLLFGSLAGLAIFDSRIWRAWGVIPGWLRMLGYDRLDSWEIGTDVAGSMQVQNVFNLGYEILGHVVKTLQLGICIWSCAYSLLIGPVMSVLHVACVQRFLDCFIFHFVQILSYGYFSQVECIPIGSSNVPDHLSLCHVPAMGDL